MMSMGFCQSFTVVEGRKILLGMYWVLLLWEAEGFCLENEGYVKLRYS